MAHLVTTEQAYAQLRVGPTNVPDAFDIGNKLDEAEDWAIDIMGRNYDPFWTHETVPPRIRAAILAMLTSLYDGDVEGKHMDLAYRLIDRWRDRVIA